MSRRRRVFLSLAAALICGFIYLSRQDHGGPPEIRKEASSRSEAECSHLKSLIINSNSTMTKFESKKFFQIVKSLQDCPWVQNQTELSLIQKEASSRSEAECSHLKSLIINSNSTMTKFESKKFFQIVKSLQHCPWVQNQTELSLIQSQLKRCCNAPYKMIVTQENTPKGSQIAFDASKKTLKVTKNLFNLFPKTSPFMKPLRSCAVVGNGGILNGSFCGAQINRNDFVFRLNLPPLSLKDDVGTKTSLVTANPSIIIKRFGSLRERRKAFINIIKAYDSSLILLPAFSYLGNTDAAVRVLYAMEDFDLTSRAVFFNPSYLKSLSAHWKSKGLKFRRMSSGLMLVSTALEVCEEVALYGFWPFSEDLNEVLIPHHYYDNVPPKPGIHAMPDEFYQYLLMHIQGVIRLNVLHC